MSALDSPDLSPVAARLWEAAVSAAAEIAAPLTGAWTPTGAPVVSGRLHLGRLRSRLPQGGPIVVAAGFSSVVWLGGEGDEVPAFGRLAFRTETGIDRRGRVVLDQRTRAWLGVADPGSFEALVMAAEDAGVLVVPVEDFARRLEAVRS